MSVEVLALGGPSPVPGFEHEARPARTIVSPATSRGIEFKNIERLSHELRLRCHLSESGGGECLRLVAIAGRIGQVLSPTSRPVAPASILQQGALVRPLQ